MHVELYRLTLCLHADALLHGTPHDTDGIAVLHVLFITSPLLAV